MIIIDVCDAGAGYFYCVAALYLRENGWLRVTDTATRMVPRDHIDLGVLAVQAELAAKAGAN